MIREGVGMGAPKIQKLVQFVVFRVAGRYNAQDTGKFGMEEHYRYHRFTVLYQVLPHR